MPCSAHQMPMQLAPALEFETPNGTVSGGLEVESETGEEGLCGSRGHDWAGYRQGDTVEGQTLYGPMGEHEFPHTAAG